MPTCPVCQQRLAIITINPFAVGAGGDMVLAPAGRSFLGISSHRLPDDLSVVTEVLTPMPNGRPRVPGDPCPGAGLAVLE